MSLKKGHNMNKIFKVIFSKAKGIFVVTGENAKAQGKSKHLKAVATSVMIASTLGMIGNAEANSPLSVISTDTTLGSAYNNGGTSSSGSFIADFGNNQIVSITAPDQISINGANNKWELDSTNANLVFVKDANATVNFTHFKDLQINSVNENAAYLLSGEGHVNFGQSDSAIDRVTLHAKNAVVLSDVSSDFYVTNLTLESEKNNAISMGAGKTVHIYKVDADNQTTTIKGGAAFAANERAGGTLQIDGGDVVTQGILQADHDFLKDVDKGQKASAENSGKISIRANHFTATQNEPFVKNDAVLRANAKATIDIIANTININPDNKEGARSISAFGGDITVKAKDSLMINGTITVGAVEDSLKLKDNGDNAYSHPIQSGSKVEIGLEDWTESSEDTRTMTINGDIISYGQDDVKPATGTSGIASQNTVQIKLANQTSSLIGAIKNISRSGADIPLGDTNGVTLDMSNGATWNATGNSTVKTITSNGANINLGSNKAAINDYTSGSKGATITMDGSKSEQLTLNNSSGSGTTLIETNGTTENQLVLKNNTVDIRLKLSKTASDRIGDQLQTVADMVDLSENTGDNAKGITAALEEGDIIGARTLQINAAGQITQVAEQKNHVMESLKDIGINNFLSFRAQMNDLDKRMGDLRTMPNTDGAWARVIAGQSQYQSNHNTYKTLQVGVDHRIGSFVLGGMASYTDGDGTLKQGSTDDTLYSFGLYGAWMNDDGQFVDVTLKRHHVASDYDLHYLGGQKAKGSFDTSGTSLSAEYGWRLGITNTNYYIEPQVELMYGHLNRFNYKTSNGVKIEQDAMKTLVGRLGVAAGWVSPDKAGSAYAKISVLNDWEGDADSKAKKDNTARRYHEDMGGTWVEYALGGTYNLTKHLSAYGELETTSGSPTRTTYQVSAGLRWSF